MKEPGQVDDFFKALPKIELHAHLSGSISRQCLHEIWLAKKPAGETDLEDPLVQMPQGKHDYDLKTFFPLFSSYIYHLVNDAASLRHATLSVLRDFAADGVVYLELRTTPRATADLTKEAYVQTVLSAIADFEAASSSSSSSSLLPPAPPSSSTDSSPPQAPLHTRLILSVDRRNTPAEACEVVALASRLRTSSSGSTVVGIDLCGDPTAGDMDALTPAFAAARAPSSSSSSSPTSPPPLGLTLHFAEVAAGSGTDAELRTLLGWRPDRLGHVIHVSPPVRQAILARGGLGLELCLSCNVRAGMVAGGFGAHHFAEWWREERAVVVLCTDDVGVFGSPLSNEYRLVAEHFDLSRQDICQLARRGIDVIFGGEAEKQRLRSIMWGSVVSPDVSVPHSR